MINHFVSENPDRSVSFTSMGQLRYLSALQFVDGVVGNSSSGLLEAPMLMVPILKLGASNNPLDELPTTPSTNCKAERYRNWPIEVKLTDRSGFSETK
jgi:hypothetical protein